MRTTLTMLLMALATGCAPKYDGLGLRAVDPYPDEVAVSSEQIVLVVGAPVLVRAEIESARRTQFERGEDALELRAEDPGVVLADRTEAPWEFVLVGVAVGETCVRVFVDGDEEACVPAQVVEPAP